MLHLLGRPVAILSGTPVFGLPEKAFVILALLRFESSSSIGRVRVASLLWGEASPEDAARNLRQVLNKVRAWEDRHHAKLMHISRTDLWLDDACVRSDLDDISAINRIGDEEQLRYLRDLCRGELLEGAPGGSSDLDRWIDQTRSRVARRIGGLVTGAARLPRPVLLAALADIRRRLPVAEELAEAQLELQDRASPAVAARPALHEVVVSHATNARLPGQSVLPRLTIVMPREVSAMPPRGVLLTSSLVEHITNELTRSRRLAVIASHTAWQLASTDFVSAAAEHVIPFVLELRLLPGSDSDNQHHSAKLINTTTREILWSDDFSATADSAHRRLREVARLASAHVVDRVEHALLREHADSSAASAYIHELMGRRQMHSLDLRRLRRARNHFRSAIEADKRFAPAWYGAARTLTREWVLCAREDPHLLADARAYAERAMELDPLDSGGERELGHAALYCNELQESISHFASAERLSPHNADVLADLADAHVHNSEIEAAAGLIEKALYLNPLAPDEYHWISGSVEFFRGAYSTARSRLKAMKDPEPAARLLAAAAAMDGDLRDAERFRQVEMANHPDFSISGWLRLMPQRDREHIDQYVSALRAAGFPQ